MTTEPQSRMRLRSLVDWKWLAMLAIVMLVATLCYGAVKRANQADELIGISRQNSDSLTALTTQIRDMQADQDARAALAGAERDQLQAQNRALQTQIKALYDWLRSHNIDVPTIAGDSHQATPNRATPRQVAPGTVNRPKAPGRKPPGLTTPGKPPGKPPATPSNPTSPPRPTSPGGTDPLHLCVVGICITTP